MRLTRGKPSTKHHEGAEEQTYAFWEQLGVALTKRAKPHAPLFFLGDANMELSFAQACYEGIGQHQPATEGTHYAGIFFANFWRTTTSPCHVRT